MSGVWEWLAGLLALVMPGMGAQPANVFNGYLEADYAYAAAETPGRIASITTEEGARVFEGQQLFTLDSRTQVAALKAAKARVHVAEANLANLETGSRAQEIAVIRAEVAQAEAERNLAANTLNRSQSLFESGNVSQAKIDTDRTALATAEAQVAELESRLKVAELPARDAQRIGAEASLDAARAEATSAQAAVDQRIVLSPATGIVDKVFFETNEVAGAGAPVISILPDGSIKALFFVPETYRAKLAVGDRVGVECDGCRPGLTATVTRMATTPQYAPPIIYSREERARLVFRVEALLADAGGLLPGQPITVRPAG